MADKLSRRNFVALLGATGFAATTSVSLGKTDPADVTINQRAAEVVGNTYLALCPAEKNLLRLNLAMAGINANNVNDAVRRDFATGRIVHVDGWALSLTEARLCALIAMDRSGRLGAA